jgi:hypothetical protein
VNSFVRVGREQSNFEILRRDEGGVSTIFKVNPNHVEVFKKIVAHVTNTQFNLAAGTADRDGHAVVKDIQLADRTVAINFDVNLRGYRQQPAYKVTLINETEK